MDRDLCLARGWHSADPSGTDRSRARRPAMAMQSARSSTPLRNQLVGGIQVAETHIHGADFVRAEVLVLERLFDLLNQRSRLLSCDRRPQGHALRGRRSSGYCRAATLGRILATASSNRPTAPRTPHPERRGRTPRWVRTRGPFAQVDRFVVAPRKHQEHARRTSASVSTADRDRPLAGSRGRPRHVVPGWSRYAA